MTPLVTVREHLSTSLNIGTPVDLKAPTVTQYEVFSSPGSDVDDPTRFPGTPTAINLLAPFYLISAPYIEPAHQLNLNSLDLPNQLLAQALTSLSPAVPSYATTSYASCLNWPEVFASLRALSAAYNHSWTRTEFYVVEFRSKLKPKVDSALLFQLDKESHREATQSGGLLKYWFGEPDGERRNLATCLWRSKEDAIAGGKGPWHRKARGVIGQMYESINVTGLRLVVEEDIESWRFEPFGT